MLKQWKQNALNKAVAGIIAQQKPGYNHKTSSCEYFIEDINGDVSKCAVGQLISEEVLKEHYDDIDGWGVVSIRRHSPEVWGNIKANISASEADAEADEELMRFMHSLQKTHDSAAMQTTVTPEMFVSTFLGMVQLLAVKHDLEWKY